MSDERLEATLAAARRAGPLWNAGRQQELKWATVARLEDEPVRRARLRLALAGAGAMLVVALAVVGASAVGGDGWRALTSGRLAWTAFTTAGAPGGPGPERALPRLADGTSIVLDGPTAVLQKTIETSDEVGFQLAAGGAHFEVARRPSRTFRVHAGSVTVHVIGTRFHVQRHENGAHVGVDRGRVLVSWWGGARELGPGEAGTFPPTGQPTAGNVPVASAPPPALAGPLAPPRTAKRPRTAPPPLTGTKPEVLFARADRARADGRPEAALGPLRQIVSLYPRDPHAPAAAFTAGRLLLESLGRPQEAALAFAQARSLAQGKDGSSAIGEDALAREVEALHAAGDSTAARQRADLYRQLFPSGPRLSTVSRFGGSKAVP